MNMSIVTCVLIDFDGTLINSIDSLYRSYCELVGLYGIEGSKEEFNSLNGPSTYEIVEILKAKHGLSNEVKDIYEKYIEIIKRNYGNSEAFSDSDIFLSSLYEQGKKLVLVTSSRAEMCLSIIEKFNWKKFFTDFVWGEDVKHSKPSSDIYMEACKRARVSNNQIVVIEDSANGVKAARTAGLAVFGLSIDFSEKDLKKAGATKVFKNLCQTLEVFETEPVKQKKEYFAPLSVDRLKEFFIFCNNLEDHPFFKHHQGGGKFSLKADFPEDAVDTVSVNFDEYYLESLLTRIRQFLSKGELFYVKKLRCAVVEEFGTSSGFDKFFQKLLKALDRPFSKANIQAFGSNGKDIIEGQTYKQLLEYRLYTGAIHSERRLSFGSETIQKGLVSAHAAVTKHLSLTLASSSMSVVQNILSFRRWIFEVAKEKGKVDLFPELLEFEKRVTDDEH